MQKLCRSLAFNQGPCWSPGVVVSTLASISEVNRRRARLVLRWVTVHFPVRDIYLLNANGTGNFSTHERVRQYFSHVARLHLQNRSVWVWKSLVGSRSRSHDISVLRYSLQGCPEKLQDLRWRTRSGRPEMADLGWWTKGWT